MKRKISPLAVAGAFGAAALGALGFAALRARFAATPPLNCRPLKPSADDHTPERIPELADRLRRLWREGTGRSGPSERELLHVLAVSWLECGAGGWWKNDPKRGDMRGSNNLGGVQCTKANLEKGPPAHYRCVAWKDKHADGREYTTGFRFYLDTPEHPAADWGAIDFLRQLSPPIRPLTAAALAASASPRELAAAMHRERYFEGDATNGKDPVAGYACSITQRAAQVAQILSKGTT